MTKLLPLVGVTLVVLAAPAIYAQTISVDHSSLTFTAPVNGPPTSLLLSVTSTPSGAVVLATAVEQTDAGVTWLSVSPTGGQTPLGLAVTVNPSALGVGTYTGSVVISQFGGTGSASVAVTLTVSSINVSPNSLTFTTSEGNTPLVESVTLASGEPLTYTATAATTNGGSWLDVSPPSGLISGYSAITAIPDSTVVPTLAPGTYNGTITITPTSGSSLSPVILPVTLTVLPPPAVNVNPAFVNLQYQVGGTNNTPQQNVILTTPGNATVGFTVSATNQPTPVGGTWITVSPASGSITSSGASVTVGYNTLANLPTGTWTGTVTVSTPNGAPASTSIPVTLVISSQPLLNVPSSTVNFTAQLNSSNPPAQTVDITSTSVSPQTYTVAASTNDGNPWLVVPTSGTTPGPLSIGVNASGLAPATYNGTVTVTGQGTGNGPQQIPVTLTVTNNATLQASFTSIALPYQIGQKQSVSQAIAVTSSNGAPLNFTATEATTSCGSSWLALGNAAGATPGPVTVAINPAGLTPGTCAGTVTIAATDAITGARISNSPLTIPVILTVSNSSLLVVSPFTPAVLTAQAGGAIQGPDSFTLTSTDSDVLNYTVTSTILNGAGNWLEITETSGSTSGNSNVLGISVQPGSLTPGTYEGTVTIMATGPGGAAVANSPLTIPVTFIVTAGSLVLNPSSLTFEQAVGGAVPPNQTVNVTSTGAPIAFGSTVYNTGTTGWLTLSSANGGTPGSISVGANGTGFVQGTYKGTVTVIAATPNAANSPAYLPVTLVVNAGTISSSPTSLAFQQVQGGPAPGAQTLTVSGTPGTISFQASANNSGSTNWLTVSPASGSTPGTLQVGVASNSLAVGSYSGSITITAAGALGSPLTIPVNLNVAVQHNLSASPTTLTFQAQPGSATPQTGSILIGSTGGITTFTATVSGGNWLSASPLSGTTPSTVTITADPTGMATGAYTGTVTLTSPNAISPIAVTVNLVIGVVSRPEVNAIANAASYALGGIAPGENVVLFGTNIGPPSLTSGTVTNGVVDSTLSATRVLFDGIPAPIIYALQTQTSVMVPYELAGHSSVNVVVEYQGVQSVGVPYTVALAQPGIYSQNAQGTGAGAIVNQNYTINLPNFPAPKGSVVSVYMTGEGDTVGAVDGAIATGLLSPLLPVTATVGGIPATVEYAGTSPGIVTGATQVNVLIPANAPSGSAVPLVITVGTGATAVTTQLGITISVQ